MLNKIDKHVVILIPAFNEENAIGEVIKKIRELYSGQKEGFKVTMVVIDDGSSDQTVKVSQQAGADYVVKHPVNRGLGASTRTGLERAYEIGADIAVKIDADFQHDPADIKKVIIPILTDEADVVFGSRFLGKITYKMPLYRKLGNEFFSYLVRKFTGLKITDGQTGLMAFSRRYLAKFDIVSDYNETQQLIIDSWRKHMRVIEVPVVFHPRRSGKSFISFKYPFKVLPTLIRFLVYSKPLHIFIPLGILFMLLSLLAVYLIYAGITTVIGDATIMILFLGGVFTIMFGLIADAIGKGS